MDFGLQVTVIFLHLFLVIKIINIIKFTRVYYEKTIFYHNNYKVKAVMCQKKKVRASAAFATPLLWRGRPCL